MNNNKGIQTIILYDIDKTFSIIDNFLYKKLYKSLYNDLRFPLVNEFMNTNLISKE